MTKQVRIENADMNTSVEVVVTVQDRVWDPEKQCMTDEWRDVETQILGYPTQMSSGLYLTDTRRLVITERRHSDPKA